MSSVTIPIPPGHVLHWRATENGFEVEFLRFLTPGNARMRAREPWNKGIRWEKRK